MTVLKREYLRTDRNGTKYYEVTETCSKCNGTGYIDYYRYNENGVCFDCNGTGVHVYTEKVMTEEHKAKLEAQRKARQEKKMRELKAQAEEKNKEFFSKMGFNEEGKAFAVLGDTYEIKEELKELGCKWNQYIECWITPVKLEQYPMYEINVNEIYRKDYTGTYSWNYTCDETDVYNRIKEANLNLKRLESSSEYVGQEKERLTINVKLVRTNWYNTQYGTTWVYTFEDEEGNNIVWKTSKDIDVEEETNIVLTGTVKEHKEYNGVKQTMLTRCKVA